MSGSSKLLLGSVVLSCVMTVSASAEDLLLFGVGACYDRTPLTGKIWTAEGGEQEITVAGHGFGVCGTAGYYYSPINPMYVGGSLSGAFNWYPISSGNVKDINKLMHPSFGVSVGANAHVGVKMHGIYLLTGAHLGYRYTRGVLPKSEGSIKYDATNFGVHSFVIGPRADVMYVTDAGIAFYASGIFGFNVASSKVSKVVKSERVAAQFDGKVGTFSPTVAIGVAYAS